LPEYSVLDTILFRYIEERESPSDIIAAVSIRNRFTDIGNGEQK
jgi:hypothetical protein